MRVIPAGRDRGTPSGMLIYLLFTGVFIKGPDVIMLLQVEKKV